MNYEQSSHTEQINRTPQVVKSKSQGMVITSLLVIRKTKVKFHLKIVYTYTYICMYVCIYTHTITDGGRRDGSVLLEHLLLMQRTLG